jgi:hypothetical protein
MFITRPNQKTLLIGEGNFSFAKSLIEIFDGKGGHITATALDGVHMMRLLSALPPLYCPSRGPQKPTPETLNPNFSKTPPLYCPTRGPYTLHPDISTASSTLSLLAAKPQTINSKPEHTDLTLTGLKEVKGESLNPRP